MTTLSTDCPLGVEDLFDTTIWNIADDHWYWCRRHEQSVRVDKKCKRCGKCEVIYDPSCPCQTGCIRVGPFMSEREANRLNWHTIPDRGPSPLGMEVER